MERTNEGYSDDHMKENIISYPDMMSYSLVIQE